MSFEVKDNQLNDKIHLGIVIVGHIDAGKSTTTGHLLLKLGTMNSRDLSKLRREAFEIGKETFLFAFFMDKSKQERERGLTINCTTQEFFTSRYHYSIIDAPGHKNFIKNMISGASQADVALLMVPANRGGFESSIAKGDHKNNIFQGQTRQHARLCHLLGIEQMIVGINKMDDPSVNYDYDRYLEIKSEVNKMLTKIGYKTKKIPFIPMSGYRGENLDVISDNMPWWEGFSVKIKIENDNKSSKISGFTLVDALNDVVQPPKRILDKPLRMPVSGLCKINGVGDVITGRIEQGILSTNVQVRFYPSNVCGRAFSIQMHHKNVNKAVSGDNIGVNVRNLPKDNMPHIGDIMCIDDTTYDPEPPMSCNSFTALVFVQDHPGKLRAAVLDDNNVYKGGFTPSVHIRTAKSPCKMISIKWKLGKKTNNQKIDDPLFIEAGDQGEIVFKPLLPIVVQSFDVCKSLGRIAVMDSNSLIMLGKINSVSYN